MERINDKMLTTASILFITALLALIIIQRAAAPEYSYSVRDMHSLTLSADALLLPDELNEKIQNGTITNYTVIDLRETPGEKLPIPTKVHEIPFGELLNKNSLKKISPSDSLILIADKESVALMARHILISKAYPNTTAAANDAVFIIHNVLNGYHPRYAKKHSSKAGFDYKRFMKAQVGAKNPSSSSIIPSAPDGQVKGPGGC